MIAEMDTNDYREISSHVAKKQNGLAVTIDKELLQLFQDYGAIGTISGITPPHKPVPRY